MGPLFTDEITSIALAISQPATSPRQQLEGKLDALNVRGSQTAESPVVTKESLIEPVQRINETLRPRGLEFAISEQSSRIITKVIDRETGDVIRQIPGEEVLLIAERLEELQGRIISLEA
ncbi:MULTISPECIES: flagellar protein FlaG [Vreelandella]|uniref:Flagellar protein FlaG n=2 Tax=Vreelandella TaxID=3137766 RepID=A0A7C9K4B5_9GAMM|nr:MULTISPECIES: flagellar protein FlaG [Halomonas]NDL70062.1 flagellar protein FlaG [Halomonas alkaliphila]NYS46043.1 flagellar protein FlaG [Halomonas zhaodongensis]